MGDHDGQPPISGQLDDPAATAGSLPAVTAPPAVIPHSRLNASLNSLFTATSPVLTQLSSPATPVLNGISIVSPPGSIPTTGSTTTWGSVVMPTPTTAGSGPQSGQALPLPSASALSAASVSPAQTLGGVPSRAASGRFSTEFPRASSPRLPSRFSGPDEIRKLVVRGFVPHIAVLASAETDELVRKKGFSGGLLQLLRPFGEAVSGQVATRDSIGVARYWDDFSIRFVSFASIGRVRPGRENTAVGGNVPRIEMVVQKHLEHADRQCRAADENRSPNTDPAELPTRPDVSLFYSLYMRRLLSGLPFVPHETFAHPAGCVIAINSGMSNPIEALRTLYATTTAEAGTTAEWIDHNYLRYYLLVHDEDCGNINSAISLFDQMKSHFGVHCHLLRLRTIPCPAGSTDNVPVRQADWLSAAEELIQISAAEARQAAAQPDDQPASLFQSDDAAVTEFVRSLVVSSLVPTMERAAAGWNTTVLAKRKGISARFVSLSKRWTLGAGRSLVGSNFSLGNSGKSNYNAKAGVYQPASAEATLRKLADYYFLLRDFSSAHEVYELVRQDFENDRAWKHYAAGNEMCALSALMMLTQPPDLAARSYSKESKPKESDIEAWIEAARFSYMKRALEPYYALRSTTLVMELFRFYNADSTSTAANLASRLLQMRLLGPVGQPLFVERLAVCHEARVGPGRASNRMRRRQAAFWATIAMQHWLKLGFVYQADMQARHVRTLHQAVYNRLKHEQRGLDAVTELPDSAAFMPGIANYMAKTARYVDQFRLLAGGEAEEPPQPPPDQAAPPEAAE